MLKTRFHARTFVVMAALVALCTAGTVALANYNLQRGGGQVRVEADGKVTLAAAATKTTAIKSGTKTVTIDISNVTNLATRTVTFPNSDTNIPIISQILTFSGPTAARTYTLPDANASLVSGVGSYKIARGVATITGSGTVVTGLTTVVSITGTMQEDASLTNGNSVTATIGDQSGAPAAGSVIIKVWKPTANNDTTPAASAAAVHVNWIAVGT